MFTFSDQDSITYTCSYNVKELPDLNEDDKSILAYAQVTANGILRDAQKACSPAGSPLFLPPIWVSNSEERNYLTRPNITDAGTLEYDMGICFGLVKGLHETIYAKYTDDNLSNIPVKMDAENIRQKIFSYAIKSMGLA